MRNNNKFIFRILMIIIYLESMIRKLINFPSTTHRQYIKKCSNKIEKTSTSAKIILIGRNGQIQSSAKWHAKLISVHRKINFPIYCSKI